MSSQRKRDQPKHDGSFYSIHYSFNTMESSTPIQDVASRRPTTTISISLTALRPPPPAPRHALKSLLYPPPRARPNRSDGRRRITRSADSDTALISGALVCQTPKETEEPKMFPPPKPVPRNALKSLLYAPPPVRPERNSSHQLSTQVANSTTALPRSTGALPPPGRQTASDAPGKLEKPQMHLLPANASDEALKKPQASASPSPPKARRSSRALKEALVSTYLEIMDSRHARQPIANDNAPEESGSTSSPVQGVSAPNNSPCAETAPRHEARINQTYTLGEALRCPSHMIADLGSRTAEEAASSLSIHDFAFVKRSDGVFTYAILAHRTEGGAEPDRAAEGRLTFVLSRSGRRKTILASQCGDCVRLVAAAGDAAAERRRDHHRALESGRRPEGRSLDDIRSEFYRARSAAADPSGGPPPGTITVATDSDLVSCLSLPGSLGGDRTHTVLSSQF